MRPILKVNIINLKQPKSVLLGTSALVCLAFAAPVMADDLTIASGTSTNDGYIIAGGDTVTLTGALTTKGANDGIETTGGTNTVIVSETGSITTGTGQFAYGIDTAGDGNTITVSGSITTTGIDGYGINNRGDNNTTTVSGSITTTANDGYGIYNRGDNNTTTVSGSITTGGVDSTGIWNLADNNTTTLTSTGVITVNGATTDGIYNGGDNTITIVHGSIFVNGNGVSLAGDKSSGIFNDGDDIKTTLSGSIKTTGDYLGGIYNYGDSGDHTVSGSITTDGTEAYGIVNSGSSGNTNTNVTTISGTVKSTGTRSAALYNKSGSGNSFTLNEGATIIGDILARDAKGTNLDATNSKLIFNLGASTSYAYSVSGMGSGTGAGQWTFSDLDGRSQVVTTTGTGCDTTITDAGNDTCNLVTAVGAANAEVQNELQYITSTSLINSLRLDTPVNTSQEETTATDVWFDAYGVSTERDASTWDTTGVVFNADTRGLTIGKPLVLGESFGLDLVFNTSQTDLDVGATKHQNIAAQSFNFGVVMTDLASSSNWDVDAFGFIGRNSYEGKRKVMNNQVSTGSETVTSSYSGTKALVGFDVDYTTPINEAVSFKGGINANLSNEKIGAYSESKYSTWNARTVSQAASGISAGLTHKRDLLSTFVTLGAEYSSLLSGEKASYTNNGTATSYTDHDASDDMISSVAVGFKYAGANGVSFEGAIKGSSSNKGLTSTSANFGLNWAF